ncbi:MAG TPA: hypothetical protein VGB59_07940 [Allosphingosinicella sp.]|jgi:hypothetical protein
MGNRLQAEWANVSGAPLLFFGAVFLVGLGIWAFVHFIYKARVERLRQDVGSEQAEVARLRGKLAEASPPAIQERQQVVSPHGVAAAARTQQSDRGNAAIQVHAARTLARAALADRRDARGIERAAAKLESTLLTVKKVYGIRTPQASGDARIDAQTWLRFLDDVWDFLRDGHVEEGREKAAAVSASYDAQPPES